jgi:hypothetical protein
VSTILDALRKAQAEGGEKPDIPEPEFSPPSPDDLQPPSGLDGPGDEPPDGPPPGGGPRPGSPPRSYKAVGVVVLGVSLGLLLGRLLLPLATAPPDSSDMLADGVAEKHDEIIAAVEAEEDKDLSPAERRLKKREEAQQKRDNARDERREKRERETASADVGDVAEGPVEAGRPEAADAQAESGKPSVAGVVSDGAAESAKVPAAGIVPLVRPDAETATLEGDAATAVERSAAAGVVVPATMPRPESPSLTAAELQAAKAGAAAGAGTGAPPIAGSAPTVLGNVVPPPSPVAPAQVPPGLDAMGRDPLGNQVAAAEPPGPQGLPQPVTQPPPPPADAPPPQALPGAPDDAPKIRLLFIQWSPTPAKRVVSLRGEGGAISVVREGDIVQGMRLAAIHPSGVEFQWRGKSFAVPVSRY